MKYTVSGVFEKLEFKVSMALEDFDFKILEGLAVLIWLAETAKRSETGKLWS